MKKHAVATVLVIFAVLFACAGCTKHSMHKWEAHEPTCGDDGNVECWYCERCDTYFADPRGEQAIEGGFEGVLVPKTGNHTFVGGVCTVCGAQESAD